ncbi:MAG: hypothetical protein CL927_05850 [Deltaproteobacteria bacterium]|nr:hypothetical protein [Deltaproteobacteria bacterium]
MPPSIRRLFRTLGGLEVDQAASCARALTAMMGQMPAVELLPGGPAQVTRARLTARALAAWAPAPWPHALMRQQDPSDPAFLPALGMHPVLAARDTTLLGMPGEGPKAWIDPDGWAGVDGGPAVGLWFSDVDGPWTLGRSPDGNASSVTEQTRTDSRVGVRTTRTVRGISCVVVHWPVLIDGRVAWMINIRMTSQVEIARQMRIAVQVRPATVEGVRPIFRLQRSADGIWMADGAAVLAFGQPGDAMVTGRLANQTDPWQDFIGDGHSRWSRPGRVDIRCAIGSCAGGEVWRTTIEPGGSVSRFAILGPSRGVPVAVARTTAASLFTSANADRRGLLASGCAVRFADPSDVAPGTVDTQLDAVRVRLLLGREREGLVGGVAAVCLARFGFIRRAGDRLATELARVRRDGSYPGGEPEDAAVLAWAAGQYVMWSGDQAWLGEQQPPWSRLLNHIASTEATPGGRALYGMGGSRRWTRVWQAGGLLASAWVLRGHERHSEWTLAGGRIREVIRHELTGDPWSGNDQRSPDGASTAALVAVWLGLVSPNHPGVQPTLDYLRNRVWHGGGVLLQGGAHTAATCIYAAVRSLVEPTYDPLAALLGLASPTGAFPTARHPARGALGDGDDALGAALFGMLALDRLQVSSGRLQLLPGIVEAENLPTPFGRVDVETMGEERRMVGRWRGKAPRLEVCD